MLLAHIVFAQYTVVTVRPMDTVLVALARGCVQRASLATPQFNRTPVLLNDGAMAKHEERKTVQLCHIPMASILFPYCYYFQYIYRYRNEAPTSPYFVFFQLAKIITVCRYNE